MSVKIYGIRGIVERFISVRIGKGSATFRFSGGALDSAALRPAQFSTSNAVEQSIIEGLPEFKRGVIKILKEVKTEEEIQQVVSSGDAYGDVTNIQSARNVLLAKGVSMDRMQTKAAIMTVAEEMGISFPNWK